MTIFQGQGIQWPPISSSFKPVTQYNEFTGIESDTVIWQPKNGHRIVLMGMILTANGTNVLAFKGSVRGVFLTIPIDAALDFDHSPSQPMFVGEVDEKIEFDASDANGSFITLYGHEDS